MKKSEQEKPSDQTREQAFAQSFAATANHAVGCISTDLLSPIVDRELQKRGLHWKGIPVFGLRLFAGCGHDHGASSAAANAPLNSSSATSASESVRPVELAPTQRQSSGPTENKSATIKPSSPTAAQGSFKSSFGKPAQSASRFSASDSSNAHVHGGGGCTDACGPSFAEQQRLKFQQRAAQRAAEEAEKEAARLAAEKSTKAEAAAKVASGLLEESRQATAALEKAAVAACPHSTLGLGQMYAAHFGSDLLAVPLAMTIQRFVPDVNRGVHWILSPLDPIYQKRAHRTATDWAKAHGYRSDATETKDYEKRIFEYETKQALPNGIVWGGIALGLDPVIQRYVFKSTVTPETMLVSGLSGAISSSALVFGARFGAPGLMQRFDQFNGDHLVTPVTRLAGQAVGINTREIERAVKATDAPDKKWTSRTAANENARNVRVA